MKLKNLVLLLLLSIVGGAILWIVERGSQENTSVSLSPERSQPQSIGVSQSNANLPAPPPPPPKNESLARLVDRNLSAKDRFTGDMDARYRNVLSIENDDIPALVYCLTDTSDMDAVRNEVAVLLRRAKYPGTADALSKILDNSNEKSRFRAFAAQHLGSMLYEDELKSEEKAVAKLRGLLVDKDIAVRREAIFALVRKRDETGIKAAVDLLHAKGPDADEARDLVIRCVHELDLREEIPEVRTYALVDNEITRIAALVVLGVWGDEDSRGVIRESLNAKSLRVRRAAQTALGNLNSIDRLLPKSRQTVVNLSQLLNHAEVGPRIGAAFVLRPMGTNAKDVVPILVDKLSRFDSSTDIQEIGADLDLIRAIGKDAKSCGQPLEKLLSERAPIYQGRTKPFVYKLRAYILLVLSDIGEASTALQPITDMLATSDSEMVFNFAAAAHATATLANAGSNLTPLLLRAIRSDFTDAAVTFESFDAPVVLKNRTSARLEAIRALAQIGPNAEIAVPALTEIAKREPNSKLIPPWSAEAKEALLKIQGDSEGKK